MRGGVGSGFGSVLLGCSGDQVHGYLGQSSQMDGDGRGYTCVSLRACAITSHVRSGGGCSSVQVLSLGLGGAGRSHKWLS